MRKTFAYGAGGVLSADIAVPDHDRELEFYSKILTTGDSPFWRDDLMNNSGTPIIGLGERTPEYEALPMQWMPHFQVSSVTGGVDRAIAMGGKTIMQAEADDDGNRQWAVLVDPVGAAFGLIPVVAPEPDATQTGSREGCISWLSLTTPDAVSSRDFYQQVIGWKAKPIEPGADSVFAVRFEMLMEDKTAVAEICEIRSEQDAIPSVWMIHLPVDDLPKSLKRVREGGGRVIREFAETESAVICDPVGIHLALQAWQ